MTQIAAVARLRRDLRQCWPRARQQRRAVAAAPPTHPSCSRSTATRCSRRRCRLAFQQHLLGRAQAVLWLPPSLEAERPCLQSHPTTRRTTAASKASVAQVGIAQNGPRRKHTSDTHHHACPSPDCSMGGPNIELTHGRVSASAFARAADVPWRAGEHLQGCVVQRATCRDGPSLPGPSSVRHGRPLRSLARPR